MQNMEQYSEPEYSENQEVHTAQTPLIENWMSKMIKPGQEHTRFTNFNFEVERELEEGETVLWSSQPGSLDSTSSVKAAWIMGSITGFLLLLTILLLITPGIANPLFIIPLLFCVIFCILTLAVVTAARTTSISLQQTYYMITDRRLVIIKAGPKQREIDGHYTVFNLNRIENPDGSGNLTFSGPIQVINGQSGTTLVGRFTNIANVRDVEALIRKTLLPARVNRVEPVLKQEQVK